MITSEHLRPYDEQDEGNRKVDEQRRQLYLGKAKIGDVVFIEVTIENFIVSD